MQQVDEVGLVLRASKGIAMVWKIKLKGFLESSYVCFFLKENIDKKKKLELSTALFLNYTLAFTESDTSDFSTLSLL